MAKRKKRVAREETMYMAAHPIRDGGFAPWGWSFSRQGVRERMTSKENVGKWGTDFVVVKVRIVEVLPKSKKSKRAKGTR